MPIRKPRSDESESDFMRRCMGELADADSNRPPDRRRPQNQRVAICMQAWRDRNKSDRALLSEVLQRAAELLRSKEGA